MAVETIIMSGKESSSSSSTTATNIAEGDEIDTTLLEKRLEGLRDTQESVQGLSLWCQANKRHSQIIMDTWLRILRKSPVEKRLTMFYLANDVIQHAKRKSDMNVVNQWVFAIQKATPHVRSPSSVSNAIARIFKIWEERGIYSKDATADLLSLLNNVSSKEKVEKKKPETYTANAEKVASFQPSQLISKVKLAYRLKSHLGTTFRTKSYCQMDLNTLKNSIKDRHHGQDVIQEMGTLVEQLRTSEMKLQAEVEERRKIVEIGEIAIVFYENVRSESKIVNAAYKNFTNRVMKAFDAVDSKLKTFEEMEKEPSPCPSPPAMAPSPTEEDDAFDTLAHLRHRTNSEAGQSTDMSSNIPFPPATSSSQLFSGDGMSGSTDAQLRTNVGYSTQPVTGEFDHIDSQQQYSSWHSANEGGAGYSMQQNLPESSQSQGFTTPASVPLQMSMQHIQPYGFPKFDQADISSIPLPPSNPTPLQSPPLPQEMMMPQYAPPLPPQPLNPPVPNSPSLFPPDHPPLPAGDRPLFSSDMRQPPDNGFLPPPPPPDNNYSSRDGIYQVPPSAMRDKEYSPQNIHAPPDNLYVSPPPPQISAENMFPPSGPPADNMMNFPPIGAHPGDVMGSDFQNPMMSPQGLPDGSHRPNGGGSSQRSEFYEEYEPQMGDNHSQNFERMHQQYVPKNNNYQPYNTPHRGRRPSRPQPPSRNLQPLLAAPNANQGFQSQSPNVGLSPQIRFPMEQSSGPNKIPSLLETPTSPTGSQNINNFRPSHSSNFDSFSSFENPNAIGANGGNELGGFPFDGFQSQQQPNPFGENNNFSSNLMSPNGNRRGAGPMRGFRGGGGGFRGSPRSRGGGPMGPRRGRF